MLPKIVVGMEEREAHGKHTVYVAECDGTLYEFDPLLRAMKDCDTNAITDENRRDIAKKHLEHEKTGAARARNGALLRWLMQKAENLPLDELTALGDSVLKYLRQCGCAPGSSAREPSPLPS